MFAFSLRQIEVFLRVCETGSFRRAADVLGVSEASVSKQMRALERGLDCLLFERRRGSAANLSVAGMSFRKRAQSFAWRGIELSLSVRPESAQDHPLYLFAGAHILEDFLRPELSGFARRHPTIALSFVPMPSRADARKAVLAGKLDGALMTVEREHDLPGSVFLANVGMAAYGSVSLLQRAERQGIARIPFLFPPRGSEDEFETFKYLRSVGVASPTVSGRYQYHDVAVGMALEGLGALVTLQSIVDAFDPSAKLCVLKPLETFQRRFYLQQTVPRQKAELLAKLFRSAAGPRIIRKRRSAIEGDR